ncbi:MAG TPA: hypothetical protein VMB48_03480 [Steroidobacteraceae bacterium]|nr:hypothetical protein [Steroidobacteraceae bacterium]
MVDAIPEEVSAACKAKYGNVAPPASTTKSSNQYILLLEFEDDPKLKQAAAEQLFMAEPGTNGSAPKAGCWPDPDPQGTKAAAALMVQGSCPTDCWGPGIRRLGMTGDPLWELSKNANWGIFLADPDGTMEVGSQDDNTIIKVWQIRVRDANHAGKVLQNLIARGLLSAKGYKGQMMIGYKPK